MQTWAGKGKAMQIAFAMSSDELQSVYYNHMITWPICYVCGAGADKTGQCTWHTAFIMASQCGSGGPTAPRSRRQNKGNRVQCRRHAALILSSQNRHLVAQLLNQVASDKNKAAQTAPNHVVSMRGPEGGPSALRSWRQQRQGNADSTEPLPCHPYGP